MTSTNWSTVISSRANTSAWCILYSFNIFVTSFSGSGPNWGWGTVDAKRTPPPPAAAPFLRVVNVTSGGFWFNRIPTVSNSRSNISRCFCNPSLPASNTINIASADRATAITSLPRPAPCAAPSIIPGKSNSWILLPLYRTTPGMQVSVVNS